VHLSARDVADVDNNDCASSRGRMRGGWGGTTRAAHGDNARKRTDERMAKVLVCIVKTCLRMLCVVVYWVCICRSRVDDTVSQEIDDTRIAGSKASCVIQGRGAEGECEWR
jgi:hypothetical protein